MDYCEEWIAVHPKFAAIFGNVGKASRNRLAPGCTCWLLSRSRHAAIAEEKAGKQLAAIRVKLASDADVVEDVPILRHERDDGTTLLRSESLEG